MDNSQGLYLITYRGYNSDIDISCYKTDLNTAIISFATYIGVSNEIFKKSNFCNGNS